MSKYKAYYTENGCTFPDKVRMFNNFENAKEYVLEIMAAFCATQDWTEETVGYFSEAIVRTSRMESPFAIPACGFTFSVEKMDE